MASRNVLWINVFVIPLLLSCSTIGNTSALMRFLQPPKHDGVSRVCHLTSENFTTVVSSAETLVLIASEGLQQQQQQQQTQKSSGQSRKCPTEIDNFAEITAQILSKRNILVCEAPVDVITTAPEETSNVGDVYVYKKNRRFSYYGKKCPSAVLSFIQKLNTSQITVITGKLDKIAFDAVKQPKVVGFFMPNTPDYQAFEEAANLFSPSIPFYVVLDRTVAKHLKLETVGEIQLVKPFDKTRTVCPTNPATVADIEAFVNGNQGVALQVVTEHNLYDPRLLNPNKTLIVAIGERASPLGGYFYNLVTKLVRNFTTTPGMEQLNIVWIDPQTFPTVHLMMDEVERTLGVPGQLPAFGTINTTTNENAWFSTALLNTTGDKKADETNLALLREFVNGVMNKTVKATKIGVQNFVRMPQTQVLPEGSDFILECVVENKVGDCLWLRNGQNIGFNLDRYPHYAWWSDPNGGDCSLRISTSQAGRDDGQWVCEVTGDEHNPTITSPPAVIVLEAQAKSEL